MKRICREKRRSMSAMRFLLLAAAFAPLQAHDIISTAVTWDREISRIVYARCASCHRASGTAFPLMTYDQARPWAAAIKESVLRRRMPPWGAVKGFGEFRNEEALTPDQIEFVTSWADGGTPEGDAKDLPPAPTLEVRPQPSDSLGGLSVSGRTKLVRPLVLDGLLPQNASGHASMKVLAQLPDGSVQPLLWLQSYDPRYRHLFLLRNPIPLPAGTVIYGVPDGTTLLLVPRKL
jgi:hypothetical protein